MTDQLLVACTGKVEDLLAAAIRDDDARYLDGFVGQLRVLSSTPMPR